MKPINFFLLCCFQSTLIVICRVFNSASFHKKVSFVCYFSDQIFSKEKMSQNYCPTRYKSIEHFNMVYVTTNWVRVALPPPRPWCLLTTLHHQNVSIPYRTRAYIQDRQRRGEYISKQRTTDRNGRTWRKWPIWISSQCTIHFIDTICFTSNKCNTNRIFIHWILLFLLDYRHISLSCLFFHHVLCR
jgi:hypothetical protein